MEVKFDKKPLECLRPVLGRVHTQEQTQEVRLPDAFPDIGKVLGSWGQVLIRDKEWRAASMSSNGGVRGWILYAPEDGTQPRVVDVWIPLQCRWDFQESQPDGVMILCPMLTDLDARSISARKIMVRVSVDTFAQAMGKYTADIFEPAQMPADVQLLTKTYPVELPVEAGEKQVQLEEKVSMAGGVPAAFKIISYHMAPVITEQKVLGNRLVFRGQAEVALLYMTQEGTIHRWDTKVPFSQYAELEQEHDPSAGAWLLPVMTATELNIEDNGQIQIQAGIAVQYTIFDRRALELVEDAFSPMREITPQIQELQFPGLLDNLTLDMHVEGKCNADGMQVIAAATYAEYPMAYVVDTGTQIRMDGHFRVLFRDEENLLTSDSVGFAATEMLASDPENEILLWPGTPAPIRTASDGDGQILETQWPVMAQVYSGRTVSSVTGLEIGEQREPDPDRPSIILRRAGDEDLWTIAKKCGSTVPAIQKANQLNGEPESGQMLLIPIC